MTDEQPLRFAVLGPVRAWRGAGQELALGPPQQRAVLAALLLRRGRPATVSELVDAVWGEELPAGAVTVLRTYVSRLRKVLEPERAAGEAPRVVVSVPDGYLLRVAEDALDLAVFERRVAEARRLRGTGDAAAVAELLHAALEVWEGTPLAGLPGPLAEAERSRLDEQRLNALESRLDIDLQLGRHGEVIAELTSLTRVHPLREQLCRLLMLALYRSGRQAEALDVYARTRDTLVAELGVEPGPPLRKLHTRMLAADPALHPPAPAEPEAPPPPPAAPWTPPAGAAHPAQLPANLAVFTGRHDELAQVRGLLSEDGGSPATVVISAIGGMAGVGKTALAVHLAHEIAHRFPDGQLFVNLRGFDPTASAMPPGEAIRTFLDALGVPAQQTPAHFDAQVALYRSLLAERRVLLLLDNARDTEQVRPLLPGFPGCMVLVTSRNQLTGLIANDGARPLTLNPLPLPEARDFLARRIGAARLAAEPRAADEIIDCCARLPLALAIVAARLATHPSFPIAAIVDELRESQGSLDAFEGGDLTTDVRAVFSLSHQALSAPAAHLFDLLGLHTGPDISTSAAAGLAGLPLRQARTLLAELTHAHLLIEHFPGRYTFHDLLRTYATERAHGQLAPGDRDAAVARLLSWYLHTADEASRHLTPQRKRAPLGTPPAGCAPLTFSTHDRALEWCEAERGNLVAAVHQAVAAGDAEVAWKLAVALWGFFYLRSHTNDWLDTNRAAVAACQAAGDRQGEAECRVSLGGGLAHLGRLAEATEQYERALPLYDELGDGRGRAKTVGNIGDIFLRTGRFEEALAYSLQSLEHHRADDNPWGTSIALSNLGEATLHLGRLDEAVGYLREALTVQRAIGNRWLEAVSLDHLGTVYHRMHRYADAVAEYHQALATHRAIGNQWGEAVTLDHLAKAQLDADEPDAARASWRRALSVLEESGHPDAEAVREKLRRLDDPGAPDASRPAAPAPDAPRPDPAG